MSLQHERDLQLLHEKRREKGSDFIRQKLDLIAPVILSKLLSTGVGKGQGTVMGEELLRQFLKSLRPEQVRAIVASLGPDQVVTMVELYERYNDREDRDAGAREGGAREEEGAGAERSSPPQAEESPNGTETEKE